ncbi:BppU family phage baseplate upper protein, partial [Bacillus mycoides]|uniref:BppU family phage baseplate upper protein n=1 Tax=Bacillus mycoides TaxID=1405 RepID=UPI0011A731D3
ATAVRITFEKADGKTVFQQDCQAINAMKGKYQIVLKTQTLAAIGNVYGQVQIIEGDKKIDSQLFVFTVKRSLSSDESVESTNEFTIIQKAIEAGEQLKNINI